MFSLFKKKQKDINLIPESQVAARGGRIKLVSGVIAAVVVVLFALVGVLLLFMSLIEGRQAKVLSSKLEQRLSEWQEVAPVAQKATIVKSKAAQIKDLSSSNKAFTLTLKKVSDLIPKDVLLKRVTLKSTNSLTLQATSADPAQIHQFVNKLKAEKSFSKAEVKSLVKSADGFVLNMDITVVGTK